jgi:RNA polymerase sigma-70 factor (ECF subfamily)
MSVPAPDQVLARSTPERRLSDPPAAGRAAVSLPRDDAELLRRLRASDERVFGAVVREWSPMLLRVAGSFGVTHASAEECVQEAWLVVIRGLDGFEGRSRLRTWVVGIVINIARRRAERDGRIELCGATELEAGPTVDPRRFRPAGERWAGGWTERGAPREWEPEAVVLAGESMERLSRGLDELPPRQRAVVTLYDVHGLTADEVCSVLELTRANQRVLLHRGRARLRQLLEDYHRPGLEMSPR